MADYKAFIALACIAGVAIGALLLAPAQSEDIFILNGGTGNDTTDCVNVGTGKYVIRNVDSGDCYVRSIVGSSDISITNTSNTIVVDFNGTAGSTDCINVGTGTRLIQNSTDNCYVRTLVAGNGISLANSTNTVTITNSLPDDTSCTNVGTGSQVYKDGECNFRTVLGSADISVTQQTNTITIDYNGTNSDDFELLVQNTTVTGSSSGVTTIVNQNAGTSSFLACVDSAGTTACAEKLTASSVLVGQTVNSMTVSIRKVASPTGTTTIGVFDTSNNVLYTFGTISTASLTTSCVSYTFTGTGSWTLSANQYVGIKSATLVSTQQIQTCATNPNQFDGVNSHVSQFFSGSWADATTWDLGATGATNAWKLEKIGSRYIEADFTSKKHLMITAELRLNQSDVMILRMNNDTGSNYAMRTNINGVVTSLVSKTQCDVLNSVVITSGDRVLLTMWVNNNQSGDRKIINGVFGYGADTSATTAPSHADFTCKWSNTASQVNNIVINGDWLTGSIITVWGYD